MQKLFADGQTDRRTVSRTVHKLRPQFYFLSSEVGRNGLPVEIHPNKIHFFLQFFVACYATLHPTLSVRRSVGPSVHPSICHTSLFWGFCSLWPHCSCPSNQVTSNTAPAHLHATGVAVYPALLKCNQFGFFSSICLWAVLLQSWCSFLSVENSLSHFRVDINVSSWIKIAFVFRSMTVIS